MRVAICAAPTLKAGSEISGPRRAIPSACASRGHCRRAADHPVDRDEHVRARIGAILERRVQREMAKADLDARRVGGDQRQVMPTIFFAAKQPIRIMEA